jgi:hypothetical protein
MECPECGARLCVVWDDGDGYLVVDDRPRWEPVPEPDGPYETIAITGGPMRRGWVAISKKVLIGPPTVTHAYVVASGRNWMRVRHKAVT